MTNSKGNHYLPLLLKASASQLFHNFHFQSIKTTPSFWSFHQQFQLYLLTYQFETSESTHCLLPNYLHLIIPTSPFAFSTSSSSLPIVCKLSSFSPQAPWVHQIRSRKLHSHSLFYEDSSTFLAFHISFQNGFLFYWKYPFLPNYFLISSSMHATSKTL